MRPATASFRCCAVVCGVEAPLGASAHNLESAVLNLKECAYIIMYCKLDRCDPVRICGDECVLRW